MSITKIFAITLIGLASLRAAAAEEEASPCGAMHDPCPGTSSVEAVLVGTASGAMVGDGFEVIVKEDSGAPIEGAYVYVDFTDTGTSPYNVDPGVWPFDVQIYPTYNSCSSGLRRILQFTDSNGRAVFAARITGFDNVGKTKVYAARGGRPEILLRTIKSRSTDIEATVVKQGQLLFGQECTGLSDWSHFSNNYTSNPSAPESDFDVNGTTSLSDLSIFSSEYLRSPQPCGSLCRP